MTDKSPEPPDTHEPPETRREGVTETRHGTNISDPYRWLERDDDEVRAWTEAQNEYATTILDTPTRDHLRPRMRERSEVPDYGPVKPEGGRYFQTVREPGDDHARLFVRESPGEDVDGKPLDEEDRPLDEKNRPLDEKNRPLDEEATPLVDPNEWPANRGQGDVKTKSLAWFLPAPDGERVAYGVVTGGDEEQVDIHVVSAPDAEEVAVREDAGRVFLGFVGFDPVSPGAVAWDADGEGLYYVATTAARADGQTATEVRHWQFDGSEETLLDGDRANGWPLVGTDPDSGTLAVAFHDVSGTDWYVRGGEKSRGEVSSEFRPVIADSDAETFAAFRNGTVFLQTDHEAPRKRLLACSLDRFRAGDLDFVECDEVLPEREAVLQSVVVTDDSVVAHYLEDARSRLAVYDHEGQHLQDLGLPDCSSVSKLRASSGEVFYQRESFHRPPTLVRAKPGTGERDELARVEVVDDGRRDGETGTELAEKLVVHRESVESTDGAEVPVFVCHHQDVERDGDNPAVLNGYGGFRSSRPPDFDRFRLPFLADGGVYARVCARGGHEYGESWHEEGMLADKQHTFDDFVAAGEFLCEAGFTSPDRLAVTGRSNGGLSVGAVLTQRPDLWAAARSSVPLLDMLRYDQFGMGGSWTTEYGDPDEPAAFEYLRDYSPYHNVESGEEYPPVLFTTGEADSRVHPCHARKMAARLQREAEGGPFLLRTRQDAGHGGGQSSSQIVTEQVEEWTFLYDHLGMDESLGTGE